MDNKMMEVSADETPKKRGKPFDSETAKKAAISAARAKKLRKKIRAEMLAELTSAVNIGGEMVKAFKSRDSKYIELIEKAIRIVGLHFDQSEDAAQNVNVKADAKIKGSQITPINVTFTDAVKKDEH